MVVTGRASSLKISATVMLMHHGMYFPSTRLPSLPSLLLHLLSEKDMMQMQWFKQDVWKKRVKREPANPDLPGRMAVKLACV